MLFALCLYCSKLKFYNYILSSEYIEKQSKKHASIKNEIAWKELKHESIIYIKLKHDKLYKLLLDYVEN